AGADTVDAFECKYAVCCRIAGSDIELPFSLIEKKIRPPDMAGGTRTDGIFTLECVNCVGACAVGPVVIHNGSYKHHMTPGKLRKIIDTARRAKKEETANV
ncbi:MAG: NAD(P)H-dependent oxidoreductase subunit E, partial [Syntrophales bacterium LBB04]|nr:NAD(P)H-dependent oxidoreductase subunit E [Syntrophales bacterium LBB04]